MLKVKNINLGFNCEDGFYQALYDVSFILKSGKIHALVGESGCGKTISAMSILQLLPPNAKILSGEIIYEGTNLLECKNMQNFRGAKIALIPQDPMSSLNPLYTIGNQLLEVIKKHQNIDGKEAYDKAIDVLNKVQIPCAESRMNAYPHEFSGGMKQRAIIAMALATNAQVLIADEPTTALDVTIQAQIMNLLKEIKNHTSILLITHDLALVSENADEVSVMYAGQIVENASAEEFFKNPKHPYSKALLKTAKNKLVTIPGQIPNIRQKISGCRFTPRCKECMDICKKEIPPAFTINENHTCSCWLNKVQD